MAFLVVAEDAPHMLRLLEMTLRRQGHQWTSFGDGNSALESIRNHHPDAAILDVIMPGMDGLEVLKALKADPKTADIPVIILTARGHTFTREQAEQSGAAAFLTKPFSPTELLDTISRHTSPAAP
ncbi:CheY-like chemotaxis protein [Haloferula luteola]|uniref:CheY-like chemotaxis protein n=1 Tax=Haloferula luteola TaxID=595692 RepID=A0A840UYM5_9BACT|nr:response regulator [Haloferula luteola]MBB5350882.1 CheY-like chemotaxis protein [Haloferula luteola]